MATSGTITGTTTNKYITAKVEWTETATSTTANTSTVTATLYYKKSSSSTASTYGTLKYSLTVNGSSTSGSVYLTLSCNDTWVQIVSKTVTVSHNSDGSKSITISATGGISGTSFTSTTLSGTATLTTLDRTAPTITISSTSVTNTSITVTATANVSCNTWQYSTNGGSSYTTFNSGAATSVTTTISGLSANTTYSLRIRAYKVSNNISAYASKSVTTLGASSITSAANRTMSDSGTACSVKFIPYSKTYYYTLTFTVGSYSVTTDRFCPGQTTVYTYTGYSFVTSEWAPYITDAASATCTVTLTTYTSSSATTAMGTATATFTLTVPASVVPSVSEITMTEAADDLPTAFSGMWVQSISKAAISITAEGIYGSSISQISVTVNGTTTTGTGDSLSITTDVLTTSGTNEVAVTVTDSRGRTASDSLEFYVYPYYAPTLSVTFDISDGTTLTVTATGGVATVNGTNTKSLEFYIQAVADSSDYYRGAFLLDASAEEYTQTFTATVADIETETFNITVTIADQYTETTVTRVTGTIALSLLRGGTGAAFFKEAEKDGLVVGGDEEVEGTLEVTKEAYITNFCDITATGEEDDEGNGSAAYVRAYNSGTGAQAQLRSDIDGSVGLYADDWILYRDSNGYDHFFENRILGKSLTNYSGTMNYSKILPHVWVGTAVWTLDEKLTEAAIFTDDEIDTYFPTGHDYNHHYTCIIGQTGDTNAQPNQVLLDISYNYVDTWYAHFSSAISGKCRINFVIIRF